MNRIFRPIAAAAGGVALLVLLAGPASAHVEPDKSEVKAGATETVGFTIPHGCKGSPTTKVEMRLPAGVTDVRPGSVEGFTPTVSGDTVTWSGGNLPDDREMVLPLTMTFPAAAGSLSFPAVQTCVSGQNSWIEATVEGQPEPDYPAPVIRVGAATVEATPDGGSDDHGGDHGGQKASTTTMAGMAEGSPTVEDTSTNTGLLVAGVAAAAVILGAGGAMFVSRRSGRNKPPGDGE